MTLAFQNESYPEFIQRNCQCQAIGLGAEPPKVPQAEYDACLALHWNLQTGDHHEDFEVDWPKW